MEAYNWLPQSSPGCCVADHNLWLCVEDGWGALGGGGGLWVQVRMKTVSFAHSVSSQGREASVCRGGSVQG